jgi:hypothetical protein
MGKDDSPPQSNWAKTRVQPTQLSIHTQTPLSLSLSNNNNSIMWPDSSKSIRVDS